jgi:hypothetical protein
MLKAHPNVISLDEERRRRAGAVMFEMRVPPGYRSIHVSPRLHPAAQTMGELENDRALIDACRRLTAAAQERPRPWWRWWR